MIRGLSRFISVPFADENQRLNSIVKNQASDGSTLQQDFPQSNLNMLMFDGSQKRAQIEALLKPHTNFANVSRAASTNIAFLSAAHKTSASAVIDEETKRIIENYRRQIKPSEIKGAPPVEGGKTPGHANSAHRVKPEAQAPILNKPDRIFSGINDNNRYVDIYYKDGSVVITEFGKKESVITAYGLIDQRKGVTPKTVNPEKFASNSRYVEIQLESKGSTTVIYPNKPRFDADDFPKNPPRPDAPLKTNGSGANGGTLSVTEPTTGSTVGVQEPPVTGKPIVTTRIPPEDAPATRPSNGGAITKASENLNRGIILLQLVQIGLAAYEATQVKADGEKYGYFVDPFMGRYVLTDPEKAAQNLPEGFELKFYFDPLYPYSPERSVTFTVKDGKFVNADKNYPDYQLYKDDKGTVQAGILL